MIHAIQRAFLVAAVFFAFGLTATAQAAGPNAAAAAASGPVSTEDYVEKAAIGDLFEIQSSELATEKSGNEEVTAFAEMMIRDHSKSSEALKSALSEGETDIDVPTALDAAHEEKLQQLQAVEGDEFDRRYLEIQVEAHEKALALHQGYAESGDDAALKAHAGTVAPTIAMHLETVKALHEAESE